MDHLHWYDLIRIAAIVLSAIALYRMSLIIWKSEEPYSERVRDWGWLIATSMALTLVTEVQQLASNSPLDYQMMFSITMAAVGYKSTRDTRPYQKLNS